MKLRRISRPTRVFLSIHIPGSVVMVTAVVLMFLKMYSIGLPLLILGAIPCWLSIPIASKVNFDSDVEEGS